MKLSYNWLGDYVAHGLDADALADRLTMAGLEVDDVERHGEALDGVVVGRVLATQRHPNADRLTLCQVDIGAGDPVPIVCGAPNVAAGQKVAVATVGTILSLPDREKPGERVAITIKSAKIRGEASQGMICAEDELGLSDDHAGILVLDAAAPIGQPFSAYLAEKGVALVDYVLDVSITPNRPDAISHIGVARDVAAVGRLPLVRPKLALPAPGGRAAERIAVEIEAPQACRRYVAMIVEGVVIQESPEWLKQRLLAIGLRPRNNVVDITNYVMYECGQPLHAFDYDQVAGRKIVVRWSHPGETFVTLDSKERKLPENTLMICDADRSVAIAGVMGGENSEVTDRTTTVLIESAYFDPSTIRRTARLLGLQTDASYRFERGVDSDGQVWAAARAASLIAELGGGMLLPGMVDAHPNPAPARTVLMRPSRAVRVLGVEIDTAVMVELLEALGFDVTRGHEWLGEPALACVVPGYRPDVEREIDLIEEVARLYGYERIPLPSHVPVAAIAPYVAPETRAAQRAQQYLTGLGFREIYTNSMLSRETAERFNLPVLTGAGHPGEVVETLKPISQEMAALRPALLPGMLAVMAHNQNHGHDTLRFLEFGHVFSKTDAPDVIVPGYGEHTSLLVALSGPAEQANWTNKERVADYYDLKGIVEGLARRLGWKQVAFTPDYAATPATAYHANVSIGGRHVGVIACLSDAVQRQYDLKAPVFFAELNWDAAGAASADIAGVKYAPISRFPSVDRDLAVIVDRSAQVGDLTAAIRSAGGTLLRALTVFDVYRGDQVPADKKSVAFGLRFSADRTLQDDEVDRVVTRVLDRLSADYGAELRR
ncbi:MAG: phenylalanine--tRNA ligase subunit beta [Rhodothermales bacterium]